MPQQGHRRQLSPISRVLIIAPLEMTSAETRESVGEFLYLLFVSAWYIPAILLGVYLLLFTRRKRP